MKKISVFVSALFSACAVFAGDSAADAIALAERTIAYVEKSGADAAKLAALKKEFAADRAWLAQVGTNAAMRAAVEREIRAVRRRVLFLHPDLAFAKLLAVQRGIPYTWDMHMVDQYLGRFSRPGPGLVAIENWKTRPCAVPLLAGKLPRGTTLNPDLHWNADRVVFAFCDETRRAPEGFDPMKFGFHPDARENKWVREVDPENPIYGGGDLPSARAEADRAHLRYFLYECAADGSWVRQLTGTERDKMETRDGRQTSLIEDVDPCYLPDGGIAFTSTRAQNFGRCHWGRYTPSFLLYRCDANGDDVRPLSFGEANEWEPSVLNDGRIIYTRWDYVNRNAVWHQSLWTTKPDGTGVAHFYGNYSERVCVGTEAKAIPGSARVVATAAAHHGITEGSLFVIDPARGEDGDAPVTRLTPESPFPESEKWNLPSTFCSPMPVNSELFFCSRAEEPIAFPKGHPRRHPGSNGATWPSPAAFGVWLVDTLGGRELIYKSDEFSTFSPIPLVKRTKPPVLASVLPPAVSAPTTGVFYVDNVYDSRLDVPKGSIKSIRVNRIVNMPACQRETLNQNRDLELYKESLGTVPVAPDGSCAFRVPAGEPIQLQALDKDGMAIVTMRSFIYSQRGEIQGCIGCHEPHGRSVRAFECSSVRNPSAPSPLDPVPEVDLGYTGAFSYLKSVAPIIEKHCAKCHVGGEGKPPKISGLEGQRFFVERKHVALASSYYETHESKPYDYFAAVSPLTKRLKSGHGGVKLSPDEWKKLILWMDFNVPEFSHGGGYSWNRPEAEGDAAEKRADVQGTCGRDAKCRCRSCWVRKGGYNLPR